MKQSPNQFFLLKSLIFKCDDRISRFNHFSEMTVLFNRFLLLGLFVIVGVAFGESQVPNLQGYVYDVHRKPIQGAIASAGSYGKATSLSDNYGHFSIEIVSTVKPGTTITLRVRKDGFQPWTQHVGLSEIPNIVTLHSIKVSNRPVTENTNEVKNPQPVSQPTPSQPAPASQIPVPAISSAVLPSTYKKIQELTKTAMQLDKEWRQITKQAASHWNGNQDICTFEPDVRSGVQLQREEIDFDFISHRDGIQPRIEEFHDKAKPLFEEALETMSKPGAKQIAPNDKMRLIGKFNELLDSVIMPPFLSDIREGRFNEKRFEALVDMLTRFVQKLGEYPES